MIQDRVLRKQWIAAGLSAGLTDRPVQAVIMGERIVIFRDDKGKARAFKDMCIHRGAALSLGCVKEGKLVCPYHAWEYDGTGACVKIPQLPANQPIPGKAKAIGYPCEERYGLIWVALDSPERDIPALPEYGAPAIRNVVWGPLEVAAKPPRVIENFLDVGHLAVVHEGFLGTSSHTEIGDYRVGRVGDIIRSDEIGIFQPDSDGTGKPKTVYYVYEVLNPLTAKFTKTDHDTGAAMSMMMTVQPVSDDLSIAYGVMGFNYELDMSDDEINRFQDTIFAQDKPVVEHQKPEDLPLDLQMELSLKMDRMSIAYRMYLRDLGVVLGTA
ncbi:Rieske 2Fe-2S domain-containing protein [Paenibacillus thailandensis]|uniref:Rieske 2Fe-2S domain-containing protein n=1 Tax=Paenibacillus thailandensis TaxID=393250 RepID=A0ABW5QUN8_9BACL